VENVNFLFAPRKEHRFRRITSFKPQTTKIGQTVRPVQVREKVNKMLSYRRQTALQGALVLTKSRRLKLGVGDNILLTL